MDGQTTIERRPVDAAVAQLLVRLVDRPLPALTLGSTLAMTVGGVALDPTRTSLTARDGVLTVRSSMPSIKDARAIVERREPSDLKGTLANGLEVTSSTVFPASFRMDDEISVGVRAHAAEIRRPSSKIRFWATEMEVRTPRRSGNLQIIRVDPQGHEQFTGANYRLKGQRDWYLLKGAVGDLHTLIVDVGDEQVIDVRALGRDFLALQFVFGQPLEIRGLTALDANGEAIGWYGLQTGVPSKRKGNLRSPVPPTPREQALVRLFELFAAALRDHHALRLDVAASYFVESLVEHLDGAYLKLEVALEATAGRWLANMGTPPAVAPFVRDLEAWKGWVTSHKAEIEAHADPKKAPILMKKIVSAARAPSTSKVELAFESFGVKLSDVYRDEINGRNVVAHAALMSATDPEARDAEGDLLRVGRVRVLLAVLMSRLVGYRGPLLGTDLRNEQHAPAELWAQVEEAGPHIIHVARAPVPVSNVGGESTTGTA